MLRAKWQMERDARVAEGASHRKAWAEEQVRVVCPCIVFAVMIAYFNYLTVTVPPYIYAGSFTTALRR